MGEMIQEEKEWDRQRGRGETSKARRILGQTQGSDSMIASGIKVLKFDC
jgi:hypothetical protein